jgi:hypothetical protein
MVHAKDAKDPSLHNTLGDLILQHLKAMNDNFI